MSGVAPVRIRRTQLERTALSDTKLTAAAISLLIERGISGTTLTAIGERAGDRRIAHGVEAQLDEIGVAHFVAAAAQFGRRGGRNGDAEQRSRHRKKKPLQPCG